MTHNFDNFGSLFVSHLCYSASTSKLEKYLPKGAVHVVSASMGTIVASIVRVMSLTCFLFTPNYMI
jgi:hypothetical protein